MKFEIKPGTSLRLWFRDDTTVVVTRSIVVGTVDVPAGHSFDISVDVDFTVTAEDLGQRDYNRSTTSVIHDAEPNETG